ncbi:MAG: transcriptional regulator PadR family protein [Candidatus Parvarchaeum acidophilus ARMAN-5]|jgi:DNA-binding PadR family transcriptional regulator|uniref:Transcriptional regulator PadR family protein n=1 Tax=Candidatus Parvarchaeum acidophilus ARMAN-5 TaxID=662762 RepID=D6GVI6_PARA5|nr:MAG: transcriptional regulator PadR family protein [Candidatus Parvarchaeum acidophilus ARMAN-5]
MKKTGCDMRGMLSFQILSMLKKNDLCGEELAKKIEKYRGKKPVASTIYPALKRLSKAGLIIGKRKGKRKVYSITKRGLSEEKRALEYFERLYAEIKN